MPVDDLTQARLTALARRQNGDAMWLPLRCLGLSKAAVEHRVRGGMWHHLHRGVYCLGDPDGIPLARESGALLAVGNGATISHKSAAAVWGLLDSRPTSVQVTLSGRKARSRSGIQIHHVELDRRDQRSPSPRAHSSAANGH